MWRQDIDYMIEKSYNLAPNLGPFECLSDPYGVQNVPKWSLERGGQLTLFPIVLKFINFGQKQPKRLYGCKTYNLA